MYSSSWFSAAKDGALGRGHAQMEEEREEREERAKNRKLAPYELRGVRLTNQQPDTFFATPRVPGFRKFAKNIGAKVVKK